jgi:Protein of unknown function (DUF2796)
MRTCVSIGVSLAATVGFAVAAGYSHAQQRRADAHEHGRGMLNIALEGSRLTMELEAPGADIVGFEHKAKTKKQKAAIEKAEEQLEAADALFQLPAAAGCILEASRVALEGEDHHHSHGAGHHGGKDHGNKEAARGDGKGKEGSADDAHSSFRAEYAFECKAPASITSIGFGYFKVFAGAQKLEVTVVTPKQQNRFEVTRSNPRIDLGGMM